ncbi:hypothetical protein BT96DRAFT_943272 [Gymnopus androsaceus JB14]|uniref:Uncharacterized protein n=1 Tax=Gymnopus androsaceus JB14 TaxID=1447944 RepID=A0A6A4HAW6_9AGAR|nr:hypothetical protein BT96DRAFT_943272 [Gymnopus androsaceus JB14]
MVPSPPPPPPASATQFPTPTSGINPQRTAYDSSVPHSNLPQSGLVFLCLELKNIFDAASPHHLHLTQRPIVYSLPIDDGASTTTVHVIVLQSGANGIFEGGENDEGRWTFEALVWSDSATVAMKESGQSQATSDCLLGVGSQTEHFLTLVDGPKMSENLNKAIIKIKLHTVEV